MCVCVLLAKIEKKSLRNEIRTLIRGSRQNVLFTSKVGNRAALLKKRCPVPVGAISGGLDKAAGATKLPGVIFVEASAKLILGVDDLLGTLALPAKVLL